ncbi:hypothetical protein NUU61_004142 [Penicillium alfredii]|uniref:Major facilitator superfamily (MFS) profile domain-containing protein n=1 Tax=Penicillium alfredii TaxID=1506179 RepID=A0A9W9FKN1_9EURO|nr:uncharacterized protein NUU61_004142 [Penicillium alfredii]KAJ5101920.1 hypothetical protein NUU61_004142 [Penicillium alfredii]
MRPSVFIPIITFGWGAMAALIGVARHQSQLIALRFLLGVFEAGFSVSKRFIIFLTAGILSGAFGSVVSGAITSTLDGTHGVRGWRWLFIVEGTATAGISLIVHWTLLDYPHSSRGLTLQEQDLVQQRLIQDGMADPTGPSSPSENRASLLTSFLQAVCSWRTWLLVPAYMTILGTLAISYFYPTLINGMGYTATNAQYMMAPLYLVSLVAIPVCFLADRNPHLRGVFLVLNLGTGVVFFALTAGIQNYTARYVFLCFINMTIWTGNALGLSFATTALASVTRDVRAIMLALMNGIAALAQLYGSALFPEDDAPGYLVGFAVLAATFAIGAVFYGVADVLFKRYPYKG